MRIPSGTIDQFIYIVGIKGSDTAGTTRQTGMGGKFRVYRSRNGGVATIFTTPTINETDATNMPGVYELLLDEDMTIGAGNYSEEMSFHITTTDTALSTDSIYPVTRVVELYNDRMTTVTGGVTLANESLAAIETSITYATKGIDQTLLGLETATDRLHDIHTETTGLDASLTYATKGIQDSIIPEFALIDASLTYATAGIKALETSITYATRGIDANTVALANLDTGLETATSGIKALRTNLATATAGIKSIDLSVSFATERIHYLATGGGVNADSIAANAALIGALNDITVSDILTTQMTEAYAADGTAPTLAQSLMLIQQMLGDFSIAGTTLTVRQLDGSSAAAAFTLDSSTSPTSITRSG